MDGHQLGERGTQRGRLARPGRAEQQQMRVLGAVELVERIECQGIPAAVEKLKPGCPVPVSRPVTGKSPASAEPMSDGYTSVFCRCPG